MLENPMPLREALDDAVEAYVDAVYANAAKQVSAIVGDALRTLEFFVDPELDAARYRVDVLINQIPLVFEAREGDG